MRSPSDISMTSAVLPRITDPVVPLPRVAEVLDRWAPITVVRGMAGYGKTTQIALWLRSVRPAPEILWLNAPARDLGAALRVWAVQFPKVSDATIRPPASRSVVVLDDAHRILDQNLPATVLRWVERRHDLHFVIATQQSVGLFRAAAGRVPINTVSGSELLFRPEEIAQLAHLAGVRLTDEHVSRLRDAFGGWPAAVRIVLDEMNGGMDTLPLTRAEQYLRHTVLPALGNEQVADADGRFALAERLTYQMIRDLSGSAPQKIIDLLEGPGYTEVRHLDDDVELVIPRFVRRVLADSFTAANPAAARSMHQLLATWFASHPGPQHDFYALHHARSAQAWEQLEAVWIRAGCSLAASHPRSLVCLLGSLPAWLKRKRPGLAVMARALSAGRVSGPAETQWSAVYQEYLLRSRRVDNECLADMPLHDMLLIGAGQIADLRARGRFDESYELSIRLETAATSRQARGELPGDAEGWFYVQRAITDHLRLRIDDAIRWYRYGWRNRTPNDAITGKVATSGLALVNAMTGHIRDAESWIRQHRIVDEAALEPIPTTDMRIDIANVLTAVDRLDRCGADRLANLRSPTLDTEFWALTAFARARHEMVFGHPSIGLKIINRARACHPADRSESATILLEKTRVELLIASGHGHRALRRLKMFSGANNTGFAAPLAWVKLLCDDPAAAKQVADQALAQDSVDVRDRVTLLIAAAIAAAETDDTAAAENTLAQALSISHDTGLIQPFALPSTARLNGLLAAVRQDLPKAIRQRLSTVHPVYPDRLLVVKLTPRERQLVSDLRRGISRSEMAEQRFVSINTIKKQLAALYRKLEVTSRTGALTRLDEIGASPDEHSQ